MLGVKTLCTAIIWGLFGLFAVALVRGGTPLTSYPGLLLGMSVILFAVHSLQHLRGFAGPRNWWPRLPQTLSMRARLVAFSATWIATVALMPHIGFILAMTGGVAGSLMALRQGRIWIILPLSGVLSLGLFSVVERILFVPMPRGPIEEAVGVFLYRLAQGDVF